MDRWIKGKKEGVLGSLDTIFITTYSTLSPDNSGPGVAAGSGTAAGDGAAAAWKRETKESHQKDRVRVWLCVTGSGTKYTTKI